MGQVRGLHSLPLTLVVDSHDGTGELVHVQTVRTRGRVLPETLIDDAKLRQIVNKVVKELLKSGDLKRRFIAMRRRLAIEAHLEIRAGADFPAAGAAQHAAGTQMRPGSHLTHQVGEPENAAEVRENKTRGRTNARVMSIGTYPEIAEQFAATGLGDRRIARELGSLIRTGRVSDDITEEQRTLLANVSYLMMVRESSRNRRNVAHVAMTLDLVAAGQWTWHTAFSAFEKTPVPGGRGNYPMSMIGAAGAVRGLSVEGAAVNPTQDGLPSGGGTEKKRRELEAREYTLVEEWIMHHLQTKQKLAQQPPNVVRENIRALFARLPQWLTTPWPDGRGRDTPRCASSCSRR